MKKNCIDTELWPVYELRDPNGEDIEHDIPAALLERYERVRKEWVAVQKELSSLVGNDKLPFWIVLEETPWL